MTTEIKVLKGETGSKLKIISDGTATGTKLIDSETGKAVPFVESISWTVDAGSAFATCTVKLVNVAIEAPSQNQ